MNFPLDHPGLQVLAWTLLHFLWQGALLGLAAKTGLRLLRRRSPQARYLFACAAMLAMTAAPVVTFLALAPLGTTTAQVAAVPATLTEIAARNPAPPIQSLSWLRQTSFALRPLLPWAVAAWMAGVSVLSLRLFGGWLWLVRLRVRLAEPAGACWQLTLNTLARRMKLRREVRIFRSFAVDTPMVIGWVKPLVLVPAAALAGLSPEALEAVLAHELAHVRRHDYLVNLLQSAVEVLLFYHPAVWWISSQVRQERELCCDDAAVALCGDPVLFARALAALEELRGAALPATRLAPAAHGGSLMNRIQRLLAPTLPPSPTRRAGLIAALAVTALGAGTVLHLQENPPKPEGGGKKAPQIHLVAREANNRLRVRMKGDVKINPGGKPGLALGEDASFELSESGKDAVRRFKVRREKGVETRSFTVNGQEQPVDETWLNARLEKVQALESKTVATAGKAKDAEGKAKEMAEKARRVEVRVRTLGKDGKETITEDVRVWPGDQDDKERRRIVVREGDGEGDVEIEELPGFGRGGVFVFKDKDGHGKPMRIDVDRIARELRFRARDFENYRDHLELPDFDFDFDFDHDPKLFRFEHKGIDGEKRIEIEKHQAELEKHRAELERRSAQRRMELLRREMERLQRRMERLQERMHEEGTPAPPMSPKAPKTPKPSVAPAPPAKAPAPPAPPSPAPKAPAPPPSPGAEL